MESLILGNLLQLVNDPLGIIDNSKQKLQPIEQQRNNVNTVNFARLPNGSNQKVFHLYKIIY